MSPLSKWLNERNLRQGELALLAGCTRPHICRVVRAQERPSASLTAYLEKVAPEVLAGQIKYIEAHTKQLRQAIKAA